MVRRTTAPPAPERKLRGMSILAEEARTESEVEQPFAEGASDAIDPDLRHRMISEAAYARYVERGYAEGYDVDDWLAAEADVDHVLLRRATRDVTTGEGQQD